MEAVSIHTSQNVTIDYVSAGLGNRILAGILDSLFKFAYIITVIIVLFSNDSFHINSSTALAILWITILLPCFLYDLLFEIFMQGQSLGKKIMKIKVVKLDGTQPSISSYLLRWLLRFFEIDLIYGMIAVVAIAGSKKRQRLGDMAAGTTVIMVKPPVSLKDTIFQAAQSSDYKIVFNQVGNLQEKDIEIMKEVYAFYKTTGSVDALHKLAEKIKQKAGIQTTMKDGEFIATLMKDYSHYKFTD